MHITDGTPEAAVGIYKEVLSVPGGDHPRHFPAMLLLAGTPAHVICEHTHVFHDEPGLLEYLGVDPLKDKFPVFRDLGIGGDQVGVIDISVAELLHTQDVGGSGELLCNRRVMVQVYAPERLDYLVPHNLLYFMSELQPTNVCEK